MAQSDSARRDRNLCGTKVQRSCWPRTLLSQSLLFAACDGFEVAGGKPDILCTHRVAGCDGRCQVPRVGIVGVDKRLQGRERSASRPALDPEARVFVPDPDVFVGLLHRCADRAAQVGGLKSVVGDIAGVEHALVGRVQTKADTDLARVEFGIKAVSPTRLTHDLGGRAELISGFVVVRQLVRIDNGCVGVGCP